MDGWRGAAAWRGAFPAMALLGSALLGSMTACGNGADALHALTGSRAGAERPADGGAVRDVRSGDEDGLGPDAAVTLDASSPPDGGGNPDAHRPDGDVDDDGGPGRCGDGTQDPGEACDSNNVPCTELGTYTWGVALCRSDCSGYDKTDCGGCTPDCSGRVCGPDGCGGSCEPGCGAGEGCDAGGGCAPLVADGAACSVETGCISGHCQNGRCCASGDCCASVADCSGYGEAAICDDARTCQGHRLDATCEHSSCVAEEIPDDSACGTGTVSKECSPYPAATCTGAVAQSEPACARECQTDADCADDGHCDATCQPDLANGLTCDEASDCASGHCANGFCCAAGTCCAMASDCPGSTDSVCADPTTCSGYRVDATCRASMCGTTQVDDDRGCTETTVADGCGYYVDVHCRGSEYQVAPECPTSCSWDGGCDLDGHCDGTCMPGSPYVPVEWVWIQGGTYSMGPDIYGHGAAHTVTVASFWITRSEVTNAQYGACRDAVCTVPDWDNRSCMIEDPWARYGRHPVICVNWQQAKTYCEWAEGRLCSEAEWEYAARSRGRAQSYPWGDADATCERAVMNDPDAGFYGCGTRSTAEVCSRSAPGSGHTGDSDQGVCDLSGNVEEWLEDCWHYTYEGAPTNGTAWTTDCGNEALAVRGGSFSDAPGGLLASTRGARLDDSYSIMGIRCCR